MKISMIACVGKNLELGKNNDLIWHLKGDMQFFKEKTINHIVVMGSKTFKALPGVLKDRTNIVLTRKKDNSYPKEVIVFNSISEFLEKYKNTCEEIFIIGGANIYREFLNLADTLYLTEVDSKTDADVYFPNFDYNLYTKEVLSQNEENGIKYKHVLYRRK